MKDKKKTRTQKTEAEYMYRARSLLKRYAKIMGCDDKEWLMKEDLGDNPYSGVELFHYVGWLIGQRGRWTKSTWRLYRAAAVFHMRVHKVPVEVVEMVESAGQEMCPKKSDNTSSGRAKKISEKDFNKIINALDLEAIKLFGTDYVLKHMMVAGLHTGLRPGEWAHAEFNNEKYVLVVKNSKNTNGRSFGETRTIHFHKDTPKEVLDSVERVCRLFNEKNHKKLFDAARKRLEVLVRKLWPRRERYPTLYTLRHQFIANCKKHGYTQIEIAALCGQGSIETAQKHYGRKLAGRGKPVVFADEQDMEKVEILNAKPDSGPEPTS